MHVITASNVRWALPQAVKYLMDHGQWEETRVGRALVSPTPVTIHYFYPKQHVLLNPIRDANPFFHLMEAMWMLAGRQDGAFLDYYVKDFSKIYGNNGIIMDAYGYRWRHGLKHDQLDLLVAHLRKDPTSRQAVLQMWGAGRYDALEPKWKPCNLNAVFRVRSGFLDMTVFNRSNDLIFGCCGANAVHFSLMQEYIAARLELEQGQYWQVSNNLHLYEEHIDMIFTRLQTMDAITKDNSTDPTNKRHLSSFLGDSDLYVQKTVPLVKYPLVFDEELEIVMRFIDDLQMGIGFDIPRDTNNPFLSHVVAPMALAHSWYKNKENKKALEVIQTVGAEDWRTAGREWIVRHIREPAHA